MRTTVIKAVAAIGAGAALVVAGAAISGTDAPKAAATTAAATPGATGTHPSGTTQQQRGTTTPQGTPPQGAPPQGFGTPATAAEAEQAAKAATATVEGDVERVIKLPDGSYEVHVIAAGGEQHVLVSKDFEVTGTQRGGPGFRPGGDDGDAAADARA